MTTKKVFILVLILTSLVVVVAFTIHKQTGVNHFKEDGFVTIFSGLQLLHISIFVFQINKHSEWKSSSAIWLIIAHGFLFLAADEIYLIHENIDIEIHRLFSIQETGLTDRIDDLLVGLYGLIGIGVLYAYRNELKMYREAFPFFIFGFVLVFIMVVLDIVTNRKDILQLIFEYPFVNTIHTFLSNAEDSLKIFAESFFFSGFYMILQMAKSREKEAVDLKVN
jgi:hypothetical protein